MEKTISELQKMNDNYGINKKSGVDVARVIQIFNIMFNESKKEEDIIVKLKEWITMLESPDFDDNDAGLVREEMKHCVKRNTNGGSA